VSVVKEAAAAWIFDRGDAATRDRRTTNGKDPEPGSAEIGCQDERVVAGDEDDAVVIACVPPGFGRRGSYEDS
jgi:hypothetical protein